MSARARSTCSLRSAVSRRSSAPSVSFSRPGFRRGLSFGSTSAVASGTSLLEDVAPQQVVFALEALEIDLIAVQHAASGRSAADRTALRSSVLELSLMRDFDSSSFELQMLLVDVGDLGDRTPCASFLASSSVPFAATISCHGLSEQ